MTVKYECIFQYEATNALADAYTVPANTQHVVSTISITNFAGGVDWITLKIAKAGAADDNSQFIYPTLPIDPLDTFQDTAGMNLSAGDIVRIQSSSNNAITVSFFGSTIT